MARGYPKFIYSDPQNTKSEGPFIVHTIPPKFIGKVSFKQSHVFPTEVEILECWDDAPPELYMVMKTQAETWLKSQIIAGAISIKEGKINLLLSKLKEWNFKEGFDHIGAFCKGNKLFYKYVGSDRYLIFNHFNARHKTLSGFDLWLAEYNDESHIGIKKPESIAQVQLSFSLDKHYGIISQYVS